MNPDGTDDSDELSSANPLARRGPSVTSLQGRAFIRRWEVDATTRQPLFDITPDDLGNPTFGYGHKVAPGERAALEQQLRGLDRAGRRALIEKIFSEDLEKAEQRVTGRLGPKVLRTLTQPQFDALVADAFNAGGGGALGPRMLRNIRDGDMAAAGREFDAFWGTDARTGEKRLMAGLVRRSLEQAAIFNRGAYDYVPTNAEVAAASSDRAGKACLAAQITGSRWRPPSSP